ncbi:MAG: transporter, partial [Saprospiraceae bacterium]|nr:transporter [Saprospiraceae bacterium]
MKLWTLTMLAVAASLQCLAQDPLVTDRPDQTESAAVVGRGVVQIETGVVFARMDNAPLDDDKFNDFLTTLVRLGISERFELRLIGAYSTSETRMPGSPSELLKESGLTPLAFGIKIRMAEENGIWPEIAFLGHITPPWTGADAFAPEYIAPDFRFSFAHTLSDRFSLGYNVGFAWNGETPNATLQYTLALGAGIAGGLGAFVELFGNAPEASDARH